MFNGDGKDYFGGLGGAEKKPVAAEKGDDKGMDDGVTTHTHKKPEGGFHSSVDKHDGYPADEMDHDGIDDAKEAHAHALAEKYGEEVGEEADEEAAPKKKVGDYMSKLATPKGEEKY